jgi:hypothetical protein
MHLQGRSTHGWTKFLTSSEPEFERDTADQSHVSGPVMKRITFAMGSPGRQANLNALTC